MRDLILSSYVPPAPKTLSENVSDAFDRAVMCMLAKDLEERFQSMKQAYEELIEVGIICSSCGHSNPDEAAYCNQCGQSLQQAIIQQFEGKSSRELQERAFELNSAMRYKEAIRFSDEAILLDEMNSYAYHTKAWALSSLRRFDEALENYNKALEFSEHNRQRARIHTNISYVYLKTQDFALCKHHLEEAIRCDQFYYKAFDLLNKLLGREEWDSSGSSEDREEAKEFPSNSANEESDD